MAIAFQAPPATLQLSATPTWFSISIDTVMSSSAPRSAGVTKNPSATMNTRQAPAATPGSDSGR